MVAARLGGRSTVSQRRRDRGEEDEAVWRRRGRGEVFVVADLAVWLQVKGAAASVVGARLGGRSRVRMRERRRRQGG